MLSRSVFYWVVLERVRLFGLVDSPILDSRVPVDSRVRERTFSALKQAQVCQDRIIRTRDIANIVTPIPKSKEMGCH